MFQISTDITALHVRPRNLWAWTVTVKLEDGAAYPALFEVKGIATSLDAAQAEMVWAERLTEMKLKLTGFSPVE